MTDIDGGPEPDEQPLENPDPATDGLAAVAERNRAGLEIEDGKSPVPRYLFPEAPAASRRAVIQFVSPSGRVVAVFGASRWVARGAWHVESVHECV